MVDRRASGARPRRCTPDDAVELFVDRAVAEAPPVSIDETQMALGRAICERLDRSSVGDRARGVTGAVVHPVRVRVGVLDERFRRAGRWPTSRMERHQTMRGTFDWSYELCNELERQVFDRLVGVPWRVRPGECARRGRPTAMPTRRCRLSCGSLVDRSLSSIASVSTVRLATRLLETMRAYGHERLVRSAPPMWFAGATRRVLWDVIGLVGSHESWGRTKTDARRHLGWCHSGPGAGGRLVPRREEWQFLPRFCSYSVGRRAPGVMLRSEHVGSASRRSAP